MNLFINNQEQPSFQEFDFEKDTTFIKKRLAEILKTDSLLINDIKTVNILLYKILQEFDSEILLKIIFSCIRETMGVTESLAEKSMIPKTSFLIFKNQKYRTIHVDNIAFFYTKNDMVFFMSFDKQEYHINHSLKEITTLVSDKQFFRVTRRYLVNFKAINEVEHYFMRKLFVKLSIDTPDKLLINKEKANSFLSWMSNR